MKIDRLISENVCLPPTDIPQVVKTTYFDFLLEKNIIFHIFIQFCSCGIYVLMFYMLAHVPFFYQTRVALLVMTVFVRSSIPAPPAHPRLNLVYYCLWCSIAIYVSIQVVFLVL